MVVDVVRVGLIFKGLLFDDLPSVLSFLEFVLTAETRSFVFLFAFVV